MPFWSIGGLNHERLEVELAGAPPEEDGIRWLYCRAAISAGKFSGNTDLNLTVDDLVCFRADLETAYKNMPGKAELKTLEDQLHLFVEIDRLGHVEVQGRLLDAAGIGNALHFIMRFDQTLLWRTISEIDELLLEIGSPYKR